MKQLSEKVAIVTGAGQGIGKGIALVLARRGVKVVCTGRRIEPIEETVSQIKAEGGEGFAMTCDSADRERVNEVVKKTVETYGSIDVIVNNGQAIVSSASVEDTSYENMLLAWQSGTIGSLNYMQAAFPYMKEQNEGRIINFASATGMFGIAGQLAYASNKEAVRGLTKVAAKEWGQYGICVNVVLPGAESPAAKAWAEKFPEEYKKQVMLNPMHRFGDPEGDIAPVICFLAGPDSCYYSGQSLLVDGANSIAP
ncbi:MAG: SDR family oxidoreductase [Oscillospiraceae bacterium]|nr:SDR family oxidoreductase [Oscillospiraceae bacterium]